jgi:hypothetical protein
MVPPVKAGPALKKGLSAPRVVNLEQIANSMPPVLVWVDIVALKKFRERGNHDLSFHPSGRERKKLDVVIERRGNDEGDSFPLALDGHDERWCRRRSRTDAFAFCRCMFLGRIGRVAVCAFI